jgi:hypothetical protein
VALRNVDAEGTACFVAGAFMGVFCHGLQVERSAA